MDQLRCDQYIMAFSGYCTTRMASHVDKFDTLDTMDSQETLMALVGIIHTFAVSVYLITYLPDLFLGD
jgi:hypothetical protein